MTKFKTITAKLRCINCHGKKTVEPWREESMTCSYCDGKGWVYGEIEVLEENNND